MPAVSCYSYKRIQLHKRHKDGHTYVTHIYIFHSILCTFAFMHAYYIQKREYNIKISEYCTYSFQRERYFSHERNFTMKRNAELRRSEKGAEENAKRATQAVRSLRLSSPSPRHENHFGRQKGSPSEHAPTLLITHDVTHSTHNARFVNRFALNNIT